MELKSIITELKNSLEGFNCRLDRQKKTVNELEEIIETEKQTKKNIMKKIEESLRDYGIPLHGPCMHYGSLKRRKKGAEGLFEKIVTLNFPNLRKEVDIQFYEVQLQ